ncbi:hypothetical protein J2778_002580 [Paraburkholderia graminis]|nr:hypothetical protein [Paraburkholderia graminis]
MWSPLTLHRRFQPAIRQATESDHDAHRPLRDNEDLRQILAYRVARKVSNALTVQYDRVMYLLGE